MSVQDKERLQDQQHRLRIEEAQHKAATQMAAKEEKELLKNPEFLKQLQNPDVDTDLWDWVKDELGPTLSGAHILGNRDDHFEEQQELLNMNKVERLVAERSPGRLLRENPRMLAQAQGITGTEEYPDPTDNPKFREPLTPREERVLRDAAEVMTTRQTLSIDGRGVDAVSTATVENRTVSNEERSAGGITERAKGVLR